MTEPNKITAGNSASWEKSLSGYPATIWTLKYSIVSAISRYEVLASAIGENYTVSITNAATNNWTPGSYRLIGFVEKTNERVTVVDKDFEVLPNHTMPIDQRSFAEKIIEAIEATILNKATKDQLTMSINGKSITRYAPEQLIAFRDRFKREIAIEKSNRKSKQLGQVSGKMQVRFK